MKSKKKDKKRTRPVKQVDKAAAIIKFQDPRLGPPTVDRAAWLAALRNRDSITIYTVIVRFLLHFEENHYHRYSKDALASFDEFMTLLTLTLTDPRFELNKPRWLSLVTMGHLLNSVAACSSLRSTEPIVASLLKQVDNFPKLCFTLNARCATQIPAKDLFDLDPLLASSWYNSYLLGVSQPTALQMKNQHQHLEEMDERWVPFNHFVTSLYFTSTYFNQECVRKVKGIMNKACKKVIADKSLFPVTNKPRKNSIAIVTNKWHRNHAVYKSASPLINQLIGHYDLTLIRTQPPDKVPDTAVTEGFNRVEHLWIDDQTGVPNIPDVFRNNDFQLIYYPDIGMSNESIWLSNVRAAPIQAMGYGHPDTSGDNSEIDYFIGGHIEEDATQWYSEKMVLIPGLAQEPAWPSYERKNNWQPSEKVRINCVWGPDKYNFRLLWCLAEISRRAKRPHEFHLFSSPGINRYGALVPFTFDIGALLPNAIVHSSQEYYDYMENAEQHDFSINSYPFGGYNTIVESFYLGLPVVTLEGDRFYNRAATYLLNQIDMPELSSKNPDRFIQLAVELIDNPELLANYRKALQEMDLRAKLFTLEGTYFLDAINHIIENHPLTETVKIG